MVATLLGLHLQEFGRRFDNNRSVYSSLVWWIDLVNSTISAAFFNEPDSQTEIPLRSQIYASNLIDQKVYYKSNVKIVSTTDSFSTAKTCK